MADTIQPGLDGLDSTKLEDSVAYAKPTPTKGPASAYALPQGTSATSVDPELLANMQAMIAERENRKNSFMERMKDAQAWWSGGVAGPQEALQNRALERARQDQELFGMRSQVSQAKTGMAQAEAQAQANKLAMGLGGGQAVAGGAGTGGGPSFTADEMQQLNLIKDPYKQQAAMFELMKIKAKSKEDMLNRAESYNDIPVYDRATGQLTKVPMVEYNQHKDKYSLVPIGAAPAKDGTAAAPSAAVDQTQITKNPILRNIAGGESGFKNVPNEAGTSTAHGVYQITKGTFNGIQKNHPELGGITWEQFQTNPRIQTAFAEAQFGDNSDVLKRNNIPENEDTHHAMWFSGNTKLATLPDNAPIAQALTPEQISANGLAGKTVGEVRNGLKQRRMQNANVSTAPATVVTPPAAAPVSTPAAPAINEWDNNASMLPGHVAPVAAPAAAPAAAPISTPAANTLPPPPAHPSTFAPPLQQAPSSGNRMQDIQQLERQQATEKANIAAEQAGKTKFSEEDYAKKAEYNNSVGTSSNTFDELNKLLDVSKGKKSVFNLAGQGFVGPAAAWLLHKEGAKDAESNETSHDTVARTLLGNKDKTDYDKIKQGAAVAQAAWAKNLVQGAGGRLTNADLALGKVAKGVGVEQTYESHMANLAKQMEAARTAYYRGVEFKTWIAKNPGASVAEFENTPEYQVDAKIKAAKDTAQKFKDVPEADYIKKDKNGAQYIVVNGKGYYL